MSHPLNLVLIALLVLAWIPSAWATPPTTDAPVHVLQAPASDTPVLRFAVIGDAEPKPRAEFPNLRAAVDRINALAPRLGLQFVAGIGDIPHKATQIQYDAATAELSRLELPFYPIMGNEEFNGTQEQFLHYANLWNSGSTSIPDIRYVVDTPRMALIFASPDRDGREFTDAGVRWIAARIEELAPKPVMLFVHGAQVGVFREGGDKGTAHPDFPQLAEAGQLRAIFSGDLHMDLDRVRGIRRVDGVHHVHIPALERTKIPDKCAHTPWFRIVSVYPNGLIQVQTINALTGEIDPEHGAMLLG